MQAKIAKTKMPIKIRIELVLTFILHLLFVQLTQDAASNKKVPKFVPRNKMEIDFLRPAVGDREITITSYVREFYGPDARIECSMVDEAGKTVSRCLMIVAYVDKSTNRAVDWPADIMALLFENIDVTKHGH
jgi:acyl-CoA thioesterase FadM